MSMGSSCHISPRGLPSAVPHAGTNPNAAAQREISCIHWTHMSPPASASVIGWDRKNPWLCCLGGVDVSAHRTQLRQFAWGSSRCSPLHQY